MGKAPKRVTILVTDEGMLTWPVYQKLSEQGHRILALPQLLPDLYGQAADPPFALVMGPRAHLMLEGMEALVAVALKNARSELYPVTRSAT